MIKLSPAEPEVRILFLVTDIFSRFSLFYAFFTHSFFVIA